MDSPVKHIGDDLPKAVGIIIAMNLQHFYYSREISHLRKRIFTQELMERNFGAIHQRQLKQPILHMAYPDQGEGPYAKKLAYRDWYRFGILQNIHQTSTWQLGLAGFSTLAAAYVDGNYSLGVGLGYIIGRYINSLFYRKPNGVHSIGSKVGESLCYASIIAGFFIFLKSYLEY